MERLFSLWKSGWYVLNSLGVRWIRACIMLNRWDMNFLGNIAHSFIHISFWLQLTYSINTNKPRRNTTHAGRSSIILELKNSLFKVYLIRHPIDKVPNWWVLNWHWCYIYAFFKNLYNTSHHILLANWTSSNANLSPFRPRPYFNYSKFVYPNEITLNKKASNMSC